MICNEIRELMSLYIDNMLDDEQVLKMQEHLDFCDECKREFEELVYISNALKCLPESNLPEEFDFRMRESLKRVKVINKKNSKRKTWIRYSSVAAIFVVGIFSIAMYNSMETAAPEIGEDFNPDSNIMRMAEMPDEIKIENPAMKSAAGPEEATPEQRIKAFSGKEEKEVNDKAGVYTNVLPVLQPDDEPYLKMSVEPYDEPMKGYVEKLNELYSGRVYTLTDWVMESNGVYIINIEVETSDGNNMVSSEIFSYRGQDGKLWKIE